MYRSGEPLGMIRCSWDVKEKDFSEHALPRLFFRKRDYASSGNLVIYLLSMFLDYAVKVLFAIVACRVAQQWYQSLCC